MGTVYAFFADGFEEIEALTTIDTLRRAGLDVEIVSVTPDEIVVGAHDVSVLCDKNFENCDFFDAELLFLPGGMPGAATLDKHEGLRKLILSFAEKKQAYCSHLCCSDGTWETGTPERTQSYLLPQFRTISGWGGLH